MTVKELQDLLSNYDPQMEVVITYDDENPYHCLDGQKIDSTYTEGNRFVIYASNLI